MGRKGDAITAPLERWLSSQSMFFVATAPNGADGHINLSPKGIDGTFRIVGPTTVAYVDLVGSGAETVAHLRETGRIGLMFCACSGPLVVFERPAAAQGLVELNDGEATRGFDSRECVFGGKELLLSFQDFVVAGLAFFVTHRRQLNRFASGADGLALLDALVLVLATRDECIGHFAEGGEGGLLVTQLGFFPSGFGLPVTAGQAAAGKHRAGGGGGG